MTIEETIKKAIEGGYKSPCCNRDVKLAEHLLEHDLGQVFLDLLFWQSLGKAMGRTWNKETGLGGVSSKENLLLAKKHPLWKSDWHCFIDHLASGGEIEEFFANL